MALWGASALLRKFNDALAWVWMSKCIVYVLAAHALLVFSDLQVVTAGDSDDTASISKYSVQSSFGFLGCLRGKPQLLELGLLQDWCFQGIPMMGIASEPHW